MTDKASAWMPFYVGDYLGDTQRLTTEQHGAYLLLILDYWRAGPAPDDDAVLAQITRLSMPAWRKHKPALARMFQVVDGVWKHKRIDQELTSAQENAARRSDKAKAAAQARWADAPGNARSMPQALLEECPPQSPISVPFPDGKETARSEDSDSEFWNTAKAFVGKESKNPGALVGKWVRDHGKRAAAEAITRAQLERPVQRVPFIEGCFRQRVREGAEYAGPMA